MSKCESCGKTLKDGDDFLIWEDGPYTCGPCTEPIGAIKVTHDELKQALRGMLDKAERPLPASNPETAISKSLSKSRSSGSTGQQCPMQEISQPAKQKGGGDV